LAKKAAAGVDFVQTQCIYDMNRFKEWMKMVRDRGVHEKCHILAGVTPLKSGGMARYMAKNVSGITIPDEIIDRIVKAKKPAEEGIRLCVEQIQELKEIDEFTESISWPSNGNRWSAGSRRWRDSHLDLH